MLPRLMRLATALLVLLPLSACHDSTGGGGGGSLKVSKNQTVELGSTLKFQVAKPKPKPENFDLAIMPVPLPIGATFNLGTGEFTFTPNPAQVGQPFKFTFFAINKNTKKVKSTDTNIEVLAGPFDGPTSIVGKVQASETSSGLAGIPVRIPGTSFETTTAADGSFVLSGVPPSSAVLEFNTQGSPGEYAFVAEPIDVLLGHPLYAGQTNVIDRPVFLPLLGAPAGTIDPAVTSVLSSPAVPGVTLTVTSSSAKFQGVNYAGEMFIPRVEADKTPAALPSTLRPGLVVAIQPAGLTFNPPAQITFPNEDGLEPFSTVDIWSVNPATGVFEIAGKGEVTADGTTIQTISGGVSASSWNFPLPAPPNGSSDTDDSNDDNQEPCGGAQVGSEANVQTGNLLIDHTLVPYRSIEEERALRFVYNSTCANPSPIVNTNLVLASNVGVPVAFSSKLSIGGVQQAAEAFTSGTAGTTRHAYQFDATTFPTSVYSTSMKLTSHYATSAVTTDFMATVLVNNEMLSPFGVGWTIDGVERLNPVANQDKKVLTGGDGSIKVFTPQDALGTSLTTEIAFVMDGSGSISGPDFSLQKLGFSSAINDPTIIPPDGSVAVAVVQFAGSSATIHVPLTTIDSEATASMVANSILSIPQQSGGTPMDAGINKAVEAIGAGTEGARQVICISTDGFPNNAQATLVAANNAVDAGIDEIDGLAVGPGADVDFLQDVVKNGFVLAVSDFQAFANAVALKLKLVIGGAPSGEFSYIVKNEDGSFTRLKKDGTRVEFNTEGLQVFVKDRNGKTTAYEYDSQARLLAVTDPLGKRTELRYVGTYLSEVEDPAGRVTKFDHDTSGNLVRITDPDGSKREFTYDVSHRLVEQTDDRGYSTSYAYSDVGRFQESSLPDGSSRKLSPSQSLAVVPNAATTSKDAPAPGLLAADVISCLTDGSGNETQIRTDRFGGIIREVDPLGRETLVTRNTDGLPTSIGLPNGAITRLSYDLDGNATKITEEGNNGTGSDDRVHQFSYNNFSQLTSYTNPQNKVAAATNVSTKLEYSAVGSNVLRITNAEGTVTEFGYDDPSLNPTSVVGLVTSRTEAQGLPIERKYLFGRDATSGHIRFVEDPLGLVSRATFDNEGRLSVLVVEGTDGPSITDQTTVYSYKAKSNYLASVTDALGGITKFAYDFAGNLEELVDARGSATTWTYDEINRLRSRTDQLGNTEIYSYDAGGNLAAHTDRNGQQFDFTYDAADRLVVKSFTDSTMPAGVGDVVFGYDANQNGDLTDDLDDIVFVENPWVTLTTTYNGFAEVATVTTSDGSAGQAVPSVALEYDYFKNGTVEQLTAGGGALASISYGYDILDRPTSIVDMPVGVSSSLSYDELNQRETITRSFGGSTCLTNYDFTEAGEVASIEHVLDPFGAATVLSTFSYTYDSVGRRSSATAERPLIGFAMDKSAYSYDSLNRLSAVIRELQQLPTDPVVLLPDEQETYIYDSVGNRVADGIAGPTWQYNAANRLLDDGVYIYEYDANGNQTRKTKKADSNQVTTYEWDSENQLVAVSLPDGTMVTYRYDGLGRRVSRSVMGTQSTDQAFVYDGFDVLLEYSRAGNSYTLERRYSDGVDIDDPLAFKDEGVAPMITLVDAIGSVCDVVDSTGASAGGRRYSAFGVPSDYAWNTSYPKGFTAREWGDEEREWYYRARYYSSDSGRFFAEDATGEAESQSNLYLYVGANPVTFVDPYGWDKGKTGIKLSNPETQGALDKILGDASLSQDQKNALLNKAKKDALKTAKSLNDKKAIEAAFKVAKKLKPLAKFGAKCFLPFAILSELFDATPAE